MTKLFHWLKAARFFADHQPLCPEAAPEWTEADAANLRQFLGRNSGRKLVLLIRYTEQATNASAVTRTSNHELNCGYAAGFRAAASWIVTLSANVPPDPDDDSEEHQGEDALAEKHSP